jgi:hypothetical protein
MQRLGLGDPALPSVVVGLLHAASARTDDTRQAQPLLIHTDFIVDLRRFSRARAPVHAARDGILATPMHWVNETAFGLRFGSGREAEKGGVGTRA